MSQSNMEHPTLFHYSSIHSVTNLGLFRVALGAREPEPLGDARLPPRDVV